MNNKQFVTYSLLIIGLVSFATSIVTIWLLQESVLLAPAQEGTLQIGSGLAGAIVNVIIVDSTVKADISDTIIFPSVVRGTEFTTLLTSGTGLPRPFLIRNEGNVLANVTVYSTGTKLFQSTSSYVRFWMTDPVPYSEGGFSVVNDLCAINGPCAAAYLCTNAARCNLPFDVSGTGVGAVLAVSQLEFTDIKDETFMNIAIYAHFDEPVVAGGTSQTTVVIIGTQSS